MKLKFLQSDKFAIAVFINSATNLLLQTGSHYSVISSTKSVISEMSDDSFVSVIFQYQVSFLVLQLPCI
jgi:hypothetical protein